MGKRSNFERSKNDFYPTPLKAVLPLVPYLGYPFTYIEPCAGKGDLITHLGTVGGICLHASDISDKYEPIDALDLTEDHVKDADFIITNPPWTREILHPMIEHFRQMKPTWLLYDSDWMFTKQARPYLKYCSTIVSVGRVKWIPDSKYTGKDNCAWYKFEDIETQTRFYND